MKISIITTMGANPWGGSEELWSAMAMEALKDKHDVSISIYDWGENLKNITELKQAGANINKRKRISYTDLKGKIKGKITQHIFAEKELLNFISKSNPDIVFLSMGGVCDLEIDSVRKFLLKLNISYYIVFHANPDSYAVEYNKLEDIRSILSKAKQLFFVSNRMRQIAERQMAFDFSKSKIVANPVNMKEIGILPYSNSDCLNFAIVGRLNVSIKGQALLLQILGSGEWKQRNWHLNIYGEGPDEQLIENLIDFYKLNNNVTLHGHVNDIRREIWVKNHILLMPSYYEGLPIALVEGMLCGRIAVATDVGGNMEIIEHNKNGFIAEAPTFYSFGKMLEYAYTQKEKFKLMGEKAYISAKKMYGKNPGKELLNKIIESKNDR